MSSSTSVRRLAVGSVLVMGSMAWADAIPYPPQEMTVDLSTIATMVDSLSVNDDTSYVWPDTYAGEIDLGGGVLIPFNTEFVSTVWEVNTPYTLQDITLDAGDMVYAYEITMPIEAVGTTELGITEVQINGVTSDILLDAALINGMGYSTPEPDVDVPSDLKMDDFSPYGDFGSQAEWEWDPSGNPRDELDNDQTIQLLLFTGPTVPVRQDIGALIGPFEPGGEDPQFIPLLIPTTVPAPGVAGMMLVGLGLGVSRRRK